MKSPQSSPSPPHQYPQAIQLKLYQAFIFSIPILFSIILFLLFYLFYLKRRASTISASAPHPLLPTTAALDLNTVRNSTLNCVSIRRYIYTYRIYRFRVSIITLSHIYMYILVVKQHDCESDLKNEVKNKLCEIKYDDCMKARDSL